MCHLGCPQSGRVAVATGRPDGDLVQFDIKGEAANDVIALLRSQSLERIGSTAIERIDTALSE